MLSLVLSIDRDAALFRRCCKSYLIKCITRLLGTRLALCIEYPPAIHIVYIIQSIILNNLLKRLSLIANIVLDNYSILALRN